MTDSFYSTLIFVLAKETKFHRNTLYDLPSPAARNAFLHDSYCSCVTTAQLLLNFCNIYSRSLSQNKHESVS
jgi:hypothetical protein